MCLEHQCAQPHEKAVHYKIPCGPWGVTHEDVFTVGSKNSICIVDNHSKFLVVKKVYTLSADDLVQTTKLIFAE